MSGRIGLGMRIETAEEFNRRSASAMLGVDHGEPFIADMIVNIRGHKPLTAAQQKAWVRAVHRYRSKITDQLVRDYAAQHAKEAD